MRKAKEGKIVAASAGPAFGFAFNGARDGYVVHEPQMQVVRDVFRMIAEERSPLTAVRRTLEERGIPAPGGGRRWFRSTIRKIVQNDCYRPHTHQEIARVVSPEVAARLDPQSRYGINWWGRRRVTEKQVADNESDGTRRYRKSYKILYKQPEEWIAIPVPDSGIPPEVVDRALTVLENNPKPSSAGKRFWELSGGVLICGECGHRMQSDCKRSSTTTNRYHHYYKCPNRRPRPGIVERCLGSRKSYRAEEVEQQVWQFISDLLKDPGQLRDDLNAMIELKRTSGARGDPEREAKAWLDKLAEVDRKRSGYIDLAADEIIDSDSLQAKLATLEETRETAQRKLEALSRRREEIEELERDRDTLLDSFEAVAPDVLDALAPEERHHVYRILQLKVMAYPDGTLEANGAFGKETIM